MLTKRSEDDDGASVSVFDEDASVTEFFPPGFDPMEAHTIASGKFALFHGREDFNPRALIRARLYDRRVARLYRRAIEAVLALLEDEQVKLWASCDRNSDDHVAMAIEGPLRNAVAGIPTVEDLCDADDHVEVCEWFDTVTDPPFLTAASHDLTRILREK